ncbi:MAG TPA: response regulator transcription factor [Abditibacteriaceae bacterium]|jgi:DNA-binding NarL/FixJ family response regulator
MSTLRILIADDSSLFLFSLLRFLAMERHLEVVGSAASGDEALEQVEVLNPDLVLMDLEMPGMSGIAATQRLKAQPRAPRVIVLTFHDSPEYRLLCTTMGADGFVSKLECDTELMPLIDELFAQELPTNKEAELI